MATTEGGRRRGAAAEEESGRESARGGGAAGRRGATRQTSSRDPGRDEELDLLTAALLGGVIGAAAGFLLRPRPRPRGVFGKLDVATERGAKRVRRMRREMGRQVEEGAKWARHRGDEIVGRFSPEDVSGEVRKYLGEARERISDAVEEELRDLRRSIRRRRRKLGV